MSITKAQMRATAKYEKKAYDRVVFRVKKGKRLIIKKHADSRGESMNGFINRVIDEAIEREKIIVDK